MLARPRTVKLRPGRRRTGPQAVAPGQVSVDNQRRPATLELGQVDDNDNDSLFKAFGPETRRNPHTRTTTVMTPRRGARERSQPPEFKNNSRTNDALQRTGTALHLSPVKSLARLHRRSKAAPAAERNVRQPSECESDHSQPPL